MAASFVLADREMQDVKRRMVECSSSEPCYVSQFTFRELVF